MNLPRLTACAAAIAAATLFAPAPALAQNEIPVTYQGRLTDNGLPVNGAVDFRFTIYDQEIGGTVVGGPLGTLGTPVNDGLFTVELVDYPRDGAADQERWLEIQARAAGGSFETLSPRQRITPAPEAGNTQAARLQPDDRVLIGTGGPLGQGAAFNTFNPYNFLIRDDEVVQTFVSEATGTPMRISAFFNESFTGAVDIDAEIRSADGVTLIASGSVLNQSAPLPVIQFDTANELLFCGEPYQIVIRYTRTIDGQPQDKATTGAFGGDVYTNGAALGQPAGIDLDAIVVVDRGVSQVTVFDDGLALLNGGVVVGPDDGGDGAAILPKASVNPGEMLGEPGLVESVAPIGGDPINTARVARVLAPVDGYVLAIGTGAINLSNSSGAAVTLESSDPFGPTFQRGVSSNVDNFVSPFALQIPVTVQGVFPISAGQQIDIYLQNAGGSIVNPQLNAMFFPTTYAAPAPAP